MLGPDDFKGHWKVRRLITDRHSDQTVDFRGAALLWPQDETTLIYNENGFVQFGDGPVMRAERKNIWRFAADHVDVRFGDDAPFHQFVAAGAVAGTDHPCGDDYYTVAYDFSAWPEWSAVWTVRGPRKDYTSTTTYSDQKKPEKPPRKADGSLDLKPLDQFVVKPLYRGG